MPLNEDFKFNIDFFRYVDSMVILDDTAYHYAKRDNQSLTCRFVKNYFELQEMRINELLGFYRENGMCDGDILKNLAGIYVRSVFSALEKNNDKRSGMSGKDRKDWLKAQLKSELYKELMPYAEPDSRLVKIMADWLKGGNTGVLLFTGKFISAVKKSFPSLFSGLKLKNNVEGKQLKKVLFGYIMNGKAGGIDKYMLNFLSTFPRVRCILIFSQHK